MAEIVYTAVTWTTGDTITEAKLDNMVANDRAVDAHDTGNEYTERSDPTTPASNKLHIYAKDKSGVSTLYVINDAGTVYELSETTPTFYVGYEGLLSVVSSFSPVIVVTKPLTIVKAYGNVKVAPTDDDILVDINKNGSTIWSTQANRLTIADAATAGTQTSFNTTALVEGDILTFDIDQVGSTLAGSDITVGLKCK